MVIFLQSHCCVPSQIKLISCYKRCEYENQDYAPNASIKLKSIGINDKKIHSLRDQRSQKTTSWDSLYRWVTAIRCLANHGECGDSWQSVLHITYNVHFIYIIMDKGISMRKACLVKGFFLSRRNQSLVSNMRRMHKWV